MERVEHDGLWTLFSPKEVPHLTELWGHAFKEEYEQLETEGLGKEIIQARMLWRAIVESAIECGGPFILFKDAINSK